MTNAHFPLFLSTALPYVNAAPHVGHALELLIGDALCRHQRQRGRDVRFTGGTDDHSLKNVRAAQARGISPQAHVSEHGDNFRRLGRVLGVELDDYLHTSRDPRHAPAVLALWQRCAAAGDLYERAYAGRFCTGCEAFLAEADLLEDRCPIHREPLEWVEEKNWFFRLSRYQAPLLQALETGRLRVEPRERLNEALSFVRAGLHDFSVSRSRSRARGFGIGVPNDPEQVIFVWFDALANYLSVLGFPENSPDFLRYWAEPSSEREHVIGKDILRFHAVYWPAILLSAGLPLPTAIKTHGYVTLEGDKIGKSAGNAIDPFGLIERCGVTALRYYFLRHIHTTKDSDFQLARLIEAHDAELAGKLGNLLERVVTLATRHADLPLTRRSATPSDADQQLAVAAQRASEQVRKSVDELALHQALQAVFELVAAANRYADLQAPWTLSRRALFVKAPECDDDLRAELAHVLWHLCEALRVTAVLLAAFLPDAARGIVERLGSPPAQLASYDSTRFGTERAFRPRAGSALCPRLRPRFAATGS